MGWKRRESRAEGTLPGVAMCAVFSTLTSLILSTSAVAQVAQYTPPGGAADEALGRRKALEKAVDDARWHAGPVRLDPAFWISDLSFVDSPKGSANVAGDERSDLTGRAGAGLRAYLPVGAKSTFAAYALPEYVWWKNRVDERRVNQRFGLGSFTFFNRLSISLTAERKEDFNYATGEVLTRYTSRKDELTAEIEVPILRRLSLYARGSDLTTESLAHDRNLDEFFAGLDREDRSYRGGVRYSPNERVHIGAGVGHTESDFADGVRDRSNAGDLWYTELGYERPKLGVELLYERNDLTGDSGSEFTGFDGSTGNARIEWRPRETFSARVYGSRKLAYAILESDSPAYIDESFGAGFDVALGWRLKLYVFGQTGTLSYLSTAGIPGGGGAAEADTESYGVDLAIELVRKANLRIGYHERRISAGSGESGGGLRDQKVSEVLASIGIGIGQGTFY